MLEGRATAGVMIGNVELYAGYQHTQVGAVPLGGPLAGLRAWF